MNIAIIIGLCIPFLNFLVGMLVAFSGVVVLLQIKKFGRIVVFAGFCGVVFLLMMAQAASLIMGRSTSIIGLTLATIGIAVVSYYGLKYLESTGTDGVAEQLKQANALGKGTFEITGAGMGCVGTGHMFIFDTKTKHVAILTEKTHRVEPFSFIRNWNLEWVEYPSGRQGNFKLKVGTSDFDQPVLFAELPNRATGEAWVERLGLLFENSK